MGILDRFTKSLQERTDIKKNIYEELGIIQPFTLLVAGQFNSFIANLSEDKYTLLNDSEKNAFNVLWDVACIDIDDFGNNIWNLKKGIFEVYNKDGIIVKFEKKSAEVNDTYDEGRANFIYLSKDGNFIINQNDRNKRAFLVYTSENISDRLVKALRYAEALALGIEIENIDCITGPTVHTTHR